MAGARGLLHELLVSGGDLRRICDMFELLVEATDEWQWTSSLPYFTLPRAA